MLSLALKFKRNATLVFFMRFNNVSFEFRSILTKYYEKKLCRRIVTLEIDD